MSSKGKVAALVLGFFLFYSVFGAINFFQYGTVNGGQDFEFHWQRVQGIDSNPTYKPLYHLIFSFARGNQLLFYSANLALIVIFIPLILYYISKSWWSVAIYFFGVSLPHQMLYGATYPQALIIAYLCIYLLNRKNFLLLGALTLLALFTHNQGLLLFFGVWALEIGELFLRDKKFFAGGILMPAQLQNGRALLQVCLVQLPLPVIYFAAKKLRSFFLIGLTIFSIVAAVQDLRAIAIAQIIFAISAGPAIQEAPKKVKWGFVLFLAAQFSFYALDFIWGTWKFIAL